jgi:hypothetical protein
MSRPNEQLHIKYDKQDQQGKKSNSGCESGYQDGNGTKQELENYTRCRKKRNTRHE